jgi:enoyl-CoA hydratase/carnithine racemase
MALPSPVREEPNMSDGIRVDDQGPIRRVTFDRPAKKNAITLAMYARFTQALAEASAREATSVLLLDAEGDAFTAGNDIGDFVRASTQPGGDASWSEAFHLQLAAFLEQLVTFPKPIVAAVNGLAIGIGSTMLLHCDLVVASSTATFQFPFTRLALVPEAGSSLLLPLRVGLQRANEWLLLGERFDARTALAAGMIAAVVPPEELATAAQARAQALASLPARALVETKRLVREPIRKALAETMRDELETVRRQIVSTEAVAAFKAFITRR